MRDTNKVVEVVVVEGKQSVYVCSNTKPTKRLVSSSHLSHVLSVCLNGRRSRKFAYYPLDDWEQYVRFNAIHLCDNNDNNDNTLIVK